MTYSRRGGGGVKICIHNEWRGGGCCLCSTVGGSVCCPCSAISASGKFNA